MFIRRHARTREATENPDVIGQLLVLSIKSHRAVTLIVE